VGKKPTRPSAPPRQKPAAARRQQEQLEQERLARQKQQQQRRLIIAAGGGVIAVAIIVAFFLLRSSDASVKSGTAIDSAIPFNGSTIGDANAPVTIVEYADFQCTSCAEMYRDALPQLLRDYIASGQVALTFVPNAILGDESLASAEAAYCAGDQGKFWQMHNTLFANQDGENKGAFSSKQLEAMAKKIGLDEAQFSSCMDAKTHAGTVQNDHAAAVQDGISSVPTFVINNGEPLGWDSWDSLKAEIDAALGN
jgi:protein-disulfide isomerase